MDSKTKRILGLDLGTTSIGWALVDEAQDEKSKSKIIKTGVRIVPLSSDESGDFEKGKATSINADRTLKRGARRSLQRYKQRREHLLRILTENKILDKSKGLNEEGKSSTFSLLKLRAKAATEAVDLHDFARVLLAINKKRGYKSSRKAKDENDGAAVDGMEVAKKLHHEKLTPGELMFQRLLRDKKATPEFYPSDLENEFDSIWKYQKQFYPEILISVLKDKIAGTNGKQTWAICKEPFKIEGIILKGKANEIKLEKYRLRKEGFTEKLELEHLAIVFQEIRNQISNTSGYLGAISDRSKELYFNQETVGQYLWKQIEKNPHARLKNQVFYRKDYEDEFDRIWDIQSKDRKNILTNELRDKIKETIIFHQRRLKSQKGQIAICELEGKEIEIEKDGKIKKKIVGPKVIPRSSPFFQEFKIWQKLNDLKFKNKINFQTILIQEHDDELVLRNALCAELNIASDVKEKRILGLANLQTKDGWEINLTLPTTNKTGGVVKGIQGNNTIATLYKAFEQMVELSGHDVSKTKSKETIKEVFDSLGINTGILEFDSTLSAKEMEHQPMYKLWHLLYSFEGDKSETGHNNLVFKLNEFFGIPIDLSKPLVNIVFKDDYGQLSAKAIKKILPFLKEGNDYYDACKLAEYNHSHSVTKEENGNRLLEDALRLLPKNSLRNPVVEKILNQMINVVNAIIDKYGKPEEVRIELARELKKSAKERSEATTGIAKATREHEVYREELKNVHPFNTGVRITKNDIIKYKLYKELASIGHRTIYTDKRVRLEELFSKQFDIEHIIPKSVLFDDSFSNKTLAERDFNRYKSNKTGIDAVIEKYGAESEGYNRYIDTIAKLVIEGKISRTKGKKLLMTADQIPDGFIDRDLRNSQYIAKKSQEILRKVFRHVNSTTGSITDRLRQDWQLVDVMKDLNWDKYDKLGLTEFETNKDGGKIRVIKDWTKRNDHRHHAMDAITVAFTTHSHVQYFNYLNARRDESHKTTNSFS